MKIKIPESLKLEHEGLHQKLAEATKSEGKIGEAARSVATIMHPHFVPKRDSLFRRSASYPN